jgi:hypothetical protein
MRDTEKCANGKVWYSVANPGNGLRTAADLTVEISGHFAEPYVDTTLTASAALGVHTVDVGSTVGVYADCQVVVANADGSSPAILTITAFDPVGLTITANFPAAYAAGSTLFAGTFSTQQPTDPIFTQAEVLSYLGRAQNEFLSKVPATYEFFENFPILLGQTFQTMPATAIEIRRVAIPDMDGNLTRLYETSQSQLSMRDPNWYYNPEAVIPTSWYADRAGIYGWGVGPVPQANYTAELITSIRDTDTLALTDGFLVPDIMIHYVKYKAMEYMWTKDGVQASPTLAALSRQRFERGVLISQRYLRGFVEAQ